jgi:hypothetical protein
MFLERDLVRLVLQLNPYAPTPNPVPNPFQANMIFGSPPTITLSGQQATAIRNAVPAAGGPIPDLDAALDNITPSFPAFNFETQDNPAYQLAWTWHFKGQERIIRRALRLPYRYQVQGGNGALATDYVLIGYEGGGGP